MDAVSPPTSALRRSLACALAAVALAAAWQWFVVRGAYAGNWSALFCTGARHALPAELRSEAIHTFPNSNGWDGQFYHLMAHDPWLRTPISAAVEAPRLRYRRILLPALAWLATAGRPAAIDWAYRACLLAFVALGAFGAAQLAARLGRSPWWGLGFLALPAAMASLDRMAVDVALAALLMAFCWFTRTRHTAALWATLALAALARDTGFAFIAAVCLAEAAARRWRHTAVFATAALPAAAWYAWLNAHTPGFPYHALVSLPFTGALDRWFHPLPYPLAPTPAALVHALDAAAVAGILLMVALTLRAVRSATPEDILLALFAALAAVGWRPGDWLETLDYARILTPPLALLALRALKTRQYQWALPLALTTPRLALQLAAETHRAMLNWFA